MRVMLALLGVLAAAMPLQSFSGVLDASDPVVDDSRHYDAYTVTMEKRQQVTIRMSSSEFDTYLIARSPAGVTMTNDDFESQGVSQLEFLAPEGGKWTIMASAYDMQGSGSYTVEVTLGAIGDVETISGRLDPSDPEALKGEYHDIHTINVDDERPFTLELTSFGFDGYLVARSPDGQTWRNDDADSTARARIGPLMGAGAWTVTVTSAMAGEVGAYDLDIIRFP